MSDRPHKTTHLIKPEERERVLAEICRIRSLGGTQKEVDEFYQAELDKHAMPRPVTS